MRRSDLWHLTKSELINQHIEHEKDDASQLDRIETMLKELAAKKKPSKPRASKKHEYDGFFEDMIWKYYPKVEGANKSKAYSCYLKRMSDGESRNYIARCTQDYAALCKATDRKVMLPASFLGIHKHYENDWTIPKSDKKKEVFDQSHQMADFTGKQESQLDPVDIYADQKEQ